MSTIFKSGVTYRKERVLFIGAIQGLTANNVLGIEEAAPEDIGVLEGIQGDDVSEILAGNVEDLADYSVSAAYANSFRVVYFYPDEIVVQIAGSRTKVSGYFMAAAAAGYLSGVSNIAIPLTKKRLAGFTLLRDKMLRPIVIENLAANRLDDPPTADGRTTSHRRRREKSINRGNRVRNVQSPPDLARQDRRRRG